MKDQNSILSLLILYINPIFWHGDLDILGLGETQCKLEARSRYPTPTPKHLLQILIGQISGENSLVEVAYY